MSANKRFQPKFQVRNQCTGEVRFQTQTREAAEFCARWWKRNSSKDSVEPVVEEIEEPEEREQILEGEGLVRSVCASPPPTA